VDHFLCNHSDKQILSCCMETMKKLGSTADLSNQPIHAIAEAAMRWTEFLNFLHVNVGISRGLYLLQILQYRLSVTKGSA